MIVFNDFSDKRAAMPSAVALGYFNGVHLGHRSVISAAVNSARAKGICSCVFTFELPSADAPASKKGRPLLTLPERKRALIAALGTEVEYSLPFSAFSGIPAESFFREVLMERIGAKTVVCGGDYRFGAGAAGDVALLAGLCAASGVELIVVPPESYAGDAISSTRIVAAVEAGELPLANSMLGAPLTLSGEAQPCAAPASQAACHCCAEAPHPAADDPEVRAFLRYKAAAAFATVSIDAPERFVRPPCGVYRALCNGEETAVAIYPADGRLRWETAARASGAAELSLLELAKPMRDYDSPETLRAALFSLSYAG